MGKVQGGRAKVLAISSSGGHWEQLMLLRPALESFDVVYATTQKGLSEKYDLGCASLVPDFNANEPLKTIRGIWPILSLVMRVRPRALITTGAAPGLVALVVVRMIGGYTIWVDSVANSERLSLSGRIAGFVAHRYYTQWEHLADGNGPLYAGGVL